MGLAADAYARQLKQLLPRGSLWKLDPGSWLSRFLLAVSDELARIDARSDDLVAEWDPSTALDTLPDWERVLGIPAAATLTQRRLAAAGRYAYRGGSTPAYFIALAASVGFVVTIAEPSANTWRIDCDLSLAAPGFTLLYSEARCGTARCGDYISSRTVAELEAVINRTKPAHTAVTFVYT